MKGKQGAEHAKAVAGGASATELAALDAQQQRDLLDQFPILAGFFKTIASFDAGLFQPDPI